MENNLDTISKLKRHYIFGIGKSGTTLLVNILNRNEQVLATPESVFIQFFYSSYRKKKKFTKENVFAILDFIKVNEKLQPFINWGFNYEYFKKLSYPIETDYDGLINIIQLQFIPPEKKEQEIEILVDKNPGNSLFGEALLKLNKESKAIIMIRDYRANILSRKEKQHWRSPNITYNAIRWLMFNKTLSQLNKNYPSKTLFIRYEDLVLDGENTILKITKFLDIPFSLEMLVANPKTSFNEADKYKHLNKSQKKILNSKVYTINQPLYKDRIEKWKDKLSLSEIKICDNICSDFGKEFQYEKFNSTITPPTTIKKSISFARGVLSIYKQQILFRLPYSIKLKRLKQIVGQLTSK